VLDVRSAERQLEQAIDDATDAIDENGRGLDINTEKGRNNQAALDEIAESAFTALEAYRENGASADVLTDKTQTLRDRLVDAAVEFGLTKAEARKYADQLGLVPSEITTRVSIPGLDGAFNDLRGYRALLSEVNNTSIATPVGGLVPRGDVGVRASGGPVGSGTVLVGEQGPELLTLRGNASVTNNARTEPALRSGGGVTVNVGTVVAQDYNAFMRQLDQRRRLAGAVGN